MPLAKVFQSGNSQAVRLPKEYRFEDAEVVIKRIGDAVLLFPIAYSATELQHELERLDADFHLERNQPKEPDTRDFGD